MAGWARSGSLARLNAAEQPVILCPPLVDRRLPARHDRIRSSVPLFLRLFAPTAFTSVPSAGPVPRPLNLSRAGVSGSAQRLL